MTETKSAPRRTSRSKGLHVERIFSTEGVHPYDEVTWERRDVVQTNWRTGDVVLSSAGSSSPTSGALTPRPSLPISISVVL